MKNKIYILGDSFCDGGVSMNHSTTGTEIFWVEILENYYKDEYEILNFSEGSRDLQTIIDCWIKILPKVTKNDFLIMCSPYYIRYRLPRSEKFYKKENWLTIRHIGQHGFYEISNDDLEFYDKKFTRKTLHKILKDNEIINSSIASSLNYKELLESLYMITPCDTYMFSWTRFKEGFKPNKMEDKSDLEIKLGKWETQHDHYIKSNGKYGVHGDFHWDEYTQQRFANYIIPKLQK
jgi:hypothetical protein